MNILYRQLAELAINETSFEKRLDFYQTHYYDNIYFISDSGEYIGFKSYQTEIQGRNVNIEPIQVGSSTEIVYHYFVKNPGVFRVPAIKNGVLCGEYYDATCFGQILYKNIEDRAMELFPIFKNKILELYGNKRIGVLGDGIANILSVLPSAELCTECEDYDLIIDTKLIPQFRNLVTKNNKIEILSPYEILRPILIEQVILYYKNNEVNFLFINGIIKKSLKDVSNEEKIRLSMTIEQVLQDSEYVHRFCGDDTVSFNKLCQHKEDLNQFVKVVSNGICNVLLDKTEEHYNIIGGRRFTVGVPNDALIKIHIFGPCVVMGLCVADEMTICSLLQRYINHEGYNVEVVNHGLAYGNDQLNDLLSMMDEPVRKGDCVIWFSSFEDDDLQDLADRDVPIINVRECVEELSDWFLDNPFHCNAAANHNIATAIFHTIDKMLGNLSDRNRYSMIESLSIDLHHNPYAILDSTELDAYIEYIKQFKCDESVKTKGAVVLNANPCTFGHIYLIQQALKLVDFLYVFLVEESIESLPYLDREYMLKESLKYHKRIQVLRGGNIMTSERVFPEYFNKSSKPSRTSLVLTHRAFGEIASSALGITFRFFGTEPNDMVTRALNESASEILPKYGIRPVFIERISLDGIYISANNVRNLLYNNQYAELAKSVPFPTYQRLLEIKHGYSDYDHEIYYKNKDYSILMDADCYIPLVDADIVINSKCYPGMFEKYGCKYLGQEWMLKIANSEEQKLSLSSEKFGQILCRQMDVLTSEIIPVSYQGKTAQLSKNWNIDDKTQFFPLAAYYEELLDSEEYANEVAFKYSIFKHIVKLKCHKSYDDELTTFWKVFIIDYLLCNARSAGNTGFLDDGTAKLSPNYDNSTWLESVSDTRFLSSDFPCQLMEFDLKKNSAYYIIKKLDDVYLSKAMRCAKECLNLYDLYENISSKEDRYLFDVVEYRYSKIFE